MKRFIPVLVLILIMSSLATGTIGVSAAIYAVTLSPPAPGTPGGETGSATLTTGTGPGGGATTAINITGLSYTGDGHGLVQGPQSAAVYAGTCSGLTSGASPTWSLTNIVGGASNTTVPTTLQSLPIHTYYYPFTIAVKDTSGNVVSCVDVGMPSSFRPLRIIDFRITNDPVTAGALYQDLSSGPLRVAIGLQGNLMGLTFAAYVRKGTCDNLDPGPPLYQLDNVVDGKSVTALPLDDFLPDGLAVDVEKPGASPGDYVACTETSPYTVTSDLKPINSNVSGQVTLTEQFSSTGTKVAIKLNLDDQSANVPAIPLLASIHRGTCSQPDPATAYPLDPVLRGSSTTYAPVFINELTRGATPYAVLVSTSAEQLNPYVACADIPYYGSGTAAPTAPPTPGGALPGMPTTGSADPSYVLLPPALGALALMMLILGLSLRRRAPQRHAPGSVRKK